MSVEIIHPYGNSYSVGTYHISDTHVNRLKRPKSTPVHGSRPSSHGHTVPGTASSTTTENGVSFRMHRPKTAAAILGFSKDCERVNQLEHEPTRRHNLDTHVPAKKNKPPPWQKSIDPPLVPFVVGPGYILSKSKSRFAVTLKDEFFETHMDEETTKKKEDHERDSLISQLQERISDLTLFLEEERLNHKQTKQKSEEFLKDKIEELESAKRLAVAEKEREWEENMTKLKTQMETEYNNYKTSSETQISRMKKEIEFLQGAFDSYKTSLHQETDDKWKRKQEELVNDLEAQKSKEIHELKLKLVQEKNLEKTQIGRDHHRAMDLMRKEHKRELDGLIRKFSNVAADLERLKKCSTELEETKLELANIRESYNVTCQQLTNITRNLTDTKVKLMAYEEQFDVKVQEVDEKYKKRIDDLMTQNTELKRLYVSKCGELYEEKILIEHDRVERVMTAKETMLSMLKSKHKAEVSLTPGLQEIENKKRVQKLRPGSAPVTKLETETAVLSAGELDQLQSHEVAEVRPTVILPEDSEEIEQLRRSIMDEITAMSKSELQQTVSNTIS